MVDCRLCIESKKAGYTPDMKSLVLTALIVGALTGVVGFGLGRRSADHKLSAKSNPGPTTSGPAKTPIDEVAPQPKKSEETASTSAPQVKSETRAESVVSSKRKLIDLLSSLLPEDKHYNALRNVATSDPAIQKRVLEEMMSTKDASMLDAAKECLWGIKDPALVQQLIDSYTGETWHERRAALASVIGMNLENESLRPHFEAILSGSDAKLQASALERTCVQMVDREREFASRLAVQLRQLVTGGATPEVRASAAAALRGDGSKEGVDFLIDRMLRDSDPNVQMKAMVALPVTYSGGGLNEKEQFQGMLLVAQDETRSYKMRRWAADRVLMGTYRYKDLVTEEQKELMMKLADKTNAPPSKGKYN